MAIDFYLCEVADEVYSSHFYLPGQRVEREYMHLTLTGEVGIALDRISSDTPYGPEPWSPIDTAGLAQLDEYGTTQWSPDEAALMVDRVRRLYDKVVTRWDSAQPGDRPTVFYSELTDFLFWLRRVFMDAAERRMFVIAVGD